MVLSPVNSEKYIITYRNNGITYADNRINPSSASYKNGYSTGYNAKKASIIKIGSGTVSNPSSTFIDLSSVEGYKTLSYGTNLFCVFKTSHFYSNNERTVDITYSFSYSPSNGILTISPNNSTATLHYEIRVSFDVYMVQ